MVLKKATFCFFNELNDFISKRKKRSLIPYRFEGNPTVKNVIESIGIPHTEIDIILVNNESVKFSYHLKNRDLIFVYPFSNYLNFSNVIHLIENPLDKPKYIVDVHLGKLAKYLRMLGYDTLYKNSYKDIEIIKIARNEKRIVLTRDLGILKNKDVILGYWLRSQNPKDQLIEVITRFNLISSIQPFHRCINCNGIIKKTDKGSVIDNLNSETIKYSDEFYQCESCKNIYWKGTHYYKMKKFIDDLLKVR